MARNDFELYIPPEIPRFRKKGNVKLFNRGHTPILKGKTYEECFGKEVADRMKREKSERMKGHPYYGGAGKSKARSVIVLDENKEFVGRYESLKKASVALGVSYIMVRLYANKKCKPKNGWEWWFEDDERWIDRIKND